MPGCDQSRTLSAQEKMDILLEEYPGEWGMRQLTDKMVRFHNTIEAIQRKKEAEGYVFGWVDGKFVILKTPEQKAAGGLPAVK